MRRCLQQRSVAVSAALIYKICLKINFISLNNNKTCMRVEIKWKKKLFLKLTLSILNEPNQILGLTLALTHPQFTDRQKWKHHLPGGGNNPNKHNARLNEWSYSNRQFSQIIWIFIQKLPDYDITHRSHVSHFVWTVFFSLSFSLSLAWTKWTFSCHTLSFQYFISK